MATHDAKAPESVPKKDTTLQKHLKAKNQQPKFRLHTHSTPKPPHLPSESGKV